MAKLVMKKKQVGANLSISAKQHTDLLKYVKDRLDFAKIFRDQELGRWKAIDKEMAGFMILDDDDKKRQQDNLKGFGPVPFDVNLPLTASQLDEAVTFITTVFFPEEGPYNAVTDAQKQEVGKAFSALMNEQAVTFKHFINFARGVFDGFKYNRGLWTVEWQRIFGAEIQNDTAGINADVKHGVLVHQGNTLCQEDVYNTLLDPSCHPSELHKDGEFFAVVKPETIFRAKRMEQNGEIFGMQDIIDDEGNRMHGEYNAHYWEQKPELFGDAVSRDASTNGYTDWVQFLTGTSGGTMLGSVEFQYVYAWLPAKNFGLSQSNVYEIWRLTIADMSRIVLAEQLKNAHGYLPMIATVPWDESTGPEASSFAEKLMPYQRFSSSQMNIHQKASRKALYGLTIYNSKVLPAMSNSDSLGGKIPTSQTADIDDIRKAVLQITDTPDTSNTLRDIENMDGLMQKILPTDLLKQVAGLERATQYQAAATVQGGNRRNLKIAKTIDSQALSVGRKIMMYNILEFQEAMEVLTPEGEVVEIAPAELRGQKYEFAISDALRGMDKLILLETMKDVLNVLVQNPQAAQEFDVAEIINYITTMIGDHTSFRQFKHKNEFDKLTPEQKQVAFGLLQQAMQQQDAAQQSAGQPQ